MKPVPTTVARRKVHFISGGGGFPVLVVEPPTPRNKMRVASVNPPIHSAGKTNFISGVCKAEIVWRMCGRARCLVAHERLDQGDDTEYAGAGHWCPWCAH